MLTITEIFIQIYRLNKNAPVYEIDCNLQFWLNLLTSISQLLLVLNSSLNTVIYQVVFLKSRKSNRENQNIKLPGGAKPYSKGKVSSSRELYKTEEYHPLNIYVKQQTFIVIKRGVEYV